MSYKLRDMILWRNLPLSRRSFTCCNSTIMSSHIINNPNPPIQRKNSVRARFHLLPAVYLTPDKMNDALKQKVIVSHKKRRTRRILGRNADSPLFTRVINNPAATIPAIPIETSAPAYPNVRAFPISTSDANTTRKRQ